MTFVTKFCPILYQFCPPKWEKRPLIEISTDMSSWQPVVKELHCHSLRKILVCKWGMKPISENIILLLANFIQAIKSFKSLKSTNLFNIVTWNSDFDPVTCGRAQIITQTLLWMGEMPLTRCYSEVANYVWQQRCFRWEELQKYK